MGILGDIVDFAVAPIKTLVVDPIMDIAGEVIEEFVPEINFPEPPEPPPTSDGTEAARAAEDERRRAAGRGRASTVLTGGQGLLAPPPTASRTLLGE